MNKMWNSAKKKEILSTRKPDLGMEIEQRKKQSKLAPESVRYNNFKATPPAMSRKPTAPKMTGFVMPHLRPHLKNKSKNEVRSDEEL